MPKNMLVGINIHNCGYTPYRTTMEQNLDDCAELGLTIIRYNNAGNTPEALAEIRRVADGCHKRGMKLMLCMDHAAWIRRDGQSPAEIEAFYEERMEGIASALQDTVDIYQVFNETDVACMGGDILNITLPGKDGLEKGEYDSVRWDGAIAGMKGALRGLKKGFPGAVTSMNFSWWHTALIYEMYRQGCRWDVVGLDWYSDAEEVSDIALIIADVRKNIPDSDIMLCETNYWMNLHSRWTEEQKAAVRAQESRDAGQAAWVSSFIRKLSELDEPKLKAVIFYELLDEPGFERNAGHYHGESHFGFIACDELGQNRVKKPVFEAAKQAIRRHICP